MAEIPFPRKTNTPFRQFYVSWATGVGDVEWTDAEYAQVGADFEIVLFHWQQAGTSPLTGTTNGTRSANIQKVKDGAAAAGHDVVAGVYVNGSYVPKGFAPNTASYPATAYAASSSSTHRYLVDNGRTFLMNPFSPDWHTKNRSSGSGNSVPDEAHDRRQNHTTTPNYDGWIIDNLGTGVTGSGYNALALGDAAATLGDGSGNDVTQFSAAAKESPPDPILGTTYSGGSGGAHWVEGTRTIAANTVALRGRTGNVRYAHFGNGGNSGGRYFAPTSPVSPLKDTCDLLMFESWSRDATAAVTAFHDESSWIEDLNAVLDLQRAGKGALLYVKVWDDAHTHPSRLTVASAQLAQDQLTMTAAHGLAVNDRVILSFDSGALGGTTIRGYYIQSVPSSTQLKLGATPSAASPVTLTSYNSTVYVNKLYVPDDDDADDADIVKIDRWVTGSYLLVTNGHSFLHFRHDQQGGSQRHRKHRWTSHIKSMGWYAETCMASIASNGSGGVGTAYASGGLLQADGTYRRLFTSGVVYVNPTGSNITVTLPFGSGDTLTDVDGTTRAGNGTISVAKNSARIMVKS